MTIKLEFNMTEDFFGDILDTALVCCEWVKTKNYKAGSLCECTLSFEARPHWHEGKPFPAGDNRNDWQIVDHVKIEAAIQKSIDRNIPINSLWYAVTECDASYIDADAADAILQIAMFDEIVFG